MIIDAAGERSEPAASEVCPGSSNAVLAGRRGGYALHAAARDRDFWSRHPKRVGKKLGCAKYRIGSRTQLHFGPGKPGACHNLGRTSGLLRPPPDVVAAPELK